MPAKDQFAERSAVVLGSGVAALTCARLLAVQGWRVHLESDGSSRPIHLMLGEPTVALLARLWNDPSLFAGARPIGARAVSWGAKPEFETLPAPGIAIAAADLARRLAARLDLPQNVASDDREAAWIVDARTGSTHQDSAAPTHAFGRRHASIAQASLRANSRTDVCVMESLERGWVFLLPIGAGQAALQFVSVPEAPALPGSSEVVAATRMIGNAIENVDPWTGFVPCMPRARLPPARPGQIAIGEVALAFDPISGDGVGHALRSVVLAATVLQAIADGEPVQKCLDDYANTLRRAMTQHLSICLGLYADAPRAGGWREEVVAMKSGIALLQDAQIHRGGTEGTEKTKWRANARQINLSVLGASVVK
jgi:hypothetical protein